MMRLHDFLDYWAHQRPRADFAADARRRLCYAEARALADRLANALVAVGLRVGDRAAVLSLNSIEYVVLYFAASKAGVALVPLNYRLTPADWSYMVRDAGARVLFASAEYARALEPVRREMDSVERFVLLDEGEVPGWEPLAALEHDQPASPPRRYVPPEADAYQMYTSGTTGPPKGAVLSQAAVSANMVQAATAFDFRIGERCLAVLPMFHAGIVPTVLAPVSRGCSLLVMERFDAARVVEALSEGGVNVTTLVPSMIQMCLNDVPDVERRDYSSLRLVHYGASPIAETTLRRALTVFRCDFLQSYGLTEATQALTYLTPEDHRLGLEERPRLLLSAGRPALGTEVMVVDDDGHPLPPGQPGEVVARGPQLMRGYWQRPDETREALRDGWLHTGDIGTLDEDGYLYVLDRKKDVIVSGGENVYPRTVEEVLLQHPAVADAAVIGVPDERWGEAVKAIVVLRAGMTVSERELLDFCRERLAGFQRPRSVDFVEALPRNPSGKVLKRVLREPYWAGHWRRVAGA